MPDLKKSSAFRCVKPLSEKTIVIEFHYFSDSFSILYGAASYLRTHDTEGKMNGNCVMGNCYLVKEKKTLSELKALRAVTMVMQY